MMKLIAKATWIITAVAALNQGLAALGFDVLGRLVAQMPALAYPLSLLIGIAGAVSLAMLFMECGSCE